MGSGLAGTCGYTTVKVGMTSNGKWIGNMTGILSDSLSEAIKQASVVVVKAELNRAKAATQMETFMSKTDRIAVIPIRIEGEGVEFTEAIQPAASS